MKKQLFSLFAFLVLALTSVVIADAQTRARAYRVTDNQVQTLLNRIETRTDTYKGALNPTLNNNSNRDNSIFEYITDFETAMDSLKQKFDSRSSAAADVENVLGRANYIQDFMTRNRLTVASQNQWRNITFDLTTLAGYYNVRWNKTVGAYPSTTYPSNPSNPNNSTTGYNVTDREVQTLLNRLEVRTTDYRTATQQRANQNTDSLNSYITDFERSSENLRRKFDSRSSNSNDVQDVLSRASQIDAYMRANRLNPRATNQWNLVRTDLNTLAGYYNVSWNSNNPTTPNNPTYPPTTPYAGLNGTYRLNVRASDNLNTILDRAVTTNVYANNRDRIRQNLERRLTPPEMLAIENVNRQFTLASSNSPQVTLTADGSTRTETTGNGRTIRVRAENIGNNVNISYEGDRTNDFFLTFEPLGTNQIRVTRKLYLENQNTQVSAVSVYDRTSSTAQWSEVNNSNTGNIGNNTGGSGNVNEFYIPNGTALTAVLNSPLSTKTSANGDRFTMEVRSPSQYQGAIIEGRVSTADRSGRVSGRAALSLEFEQIRLRNGQTYRFSGLIDSVKNSNGDTVNINNEGVVRDGNQTTKTVARAGIGAALGALIGAIAGGGSGAAIGAGVGAGAGAGSVILQGRDDLELNSGTEFNLTSSAPANLRTGQN